MLLSSQLNFWWFNDFYFNKTQTNLFRCHCHEYLFLLIFKLKNHMPKNWVFRFNIYIYMVPFLYQSLAAFSYRLIFAFLIGLLMLHTSERWTKIWKSLIKITMTWLSSVSLVEYSTIYLVNYNNRVCLYWSNLYHIINWKKISLGRSIRKGSCRRLLED